MNTVIPSTCNSPRTKTVLIVDDEAPAIANLAWLLAKRPQWELLGACCTSEQAKAHLRTTPADLILLDIQMPGQSGLEFARELSQDPAAPLIVFITAYDEHALNAFGVFALDYVLKPFDEERFDQMLDRASRTLELKQQAALNSALGDFMRDRTAHAGGIPAPALQHVVVRTTGAIERIAIDDIAWIGTAGNYIELHLAERVVLHRTTITAIAERLPEPDFIRVHRTAIVRRSAIVGLRCESGGLYDVQLAGGDTVRVSNRYLKQVQAMFA